MKTNIANALGFRTTQYDMAVDLTDTVVRKYGSENVTTTGHSLGGGLATTGSAATGARGITFNASGTSDRVLSRYGGTPDRALALVRNHTTSRDELSAVQKYIPGVPRSRAVPVDSGSRGGHGIANFDY